MLRVSENFKLRLQNELGVRCRHNPRYSLRAFARFLDIESSALSRILRGKRAVSPKMFHHFCARLGLSPQEIASYHAEKEGLSLVELEQGTFDLLARWHNFAILELVITRGFQPNRRWIARRLGLSLSETNLALENLKRHGLLKEDVSGNLEITTPNTTTTHIPGSSAALRMLQKDVLHKAQEALENVPVEERDQSSVCLAVSKKRLLEAKERIRQFRREMIAMMESESSKEEVYQLVVSFYPVSRPIRRIDEKANVTVANPAPVGGMGRP